MIKIKHLVYGGIIISLLGFGYYCMDEFSKGINIFEEKTSKMEKLIEDEISKPINP